MSLPERPSADEAFMAMAYDLSLRSTCKRASVGALVVSPDGLQILGIGYNGAPAGMPHCTDQGEVLPGACGCIHAELNAILKAPGTMPNLQLYTTTAPCFDCAKMILNTGITRVVVGKWYRDARGANLLQERGIRVDFQFSNL